MVRIRQVALVGQDIDWSVNLLTNLLDTHVAFRDPGIVPAFGGMFNALMPCGDCFLEVLSPVDGGYEVGSPSLSPPLCPPYSTNTTTLLLLCPRRIPPA
jgi:hypothetical protein